MKFKTFTYYTLISIITAGCFAVLDKHLEGFYIIAFGSLAFGLIFLGRAVQNMLKPNKGSNLLVDTVEYLALALVGAVYFCKAYIVLFLGINLLYVVALVPLLFVVAMKARLVNKHKAQLDPSVFWVRLLLLGTFALFVIADIYNSLFYALPIALIIIALASTLITLAFVSFKSITTFLATEKGTSFIKSEDFRSFWLHLGFVLLFSYQLAIHYGISDDVRFNRLPKDYVDLFYDAESGKEQPVDGKYQFQIYKEGYDKFVNTYVRDDN